MLIKLDTYKERDIVLIKKTANRIYRDNIGFAAPMRKFLGKKIIIQEVVDEGRGKIYYCSNGWIWHPDWIKGKIYGTKLT